MKAAPVLIKKYGNRRLCVGPKTVDYLKILVGLQGAAIDGRLRKFLGMAGIAAISGVTKAQAGKHTHRSHSGKWSSQGSQKRHKYWQSKKKRYSSPIEIPPTESPHEDQRHPNRSQAYTRPRFLECMVEVSCLEAAPVRPADHDGPVAVSLAKGFHSALLGRNVG